jgi:hypothetical protein
MSDRIVSDSGFRPMTDDAHADAVSEALAVEGLATIADAIDGFLDMHGLISAHGSEEFESILVDHDEDYGYRVGLYVDAQASDVPAVSLDVPTVDLAIAAVRVLRHVTFTSEGGTDR